MLHPWSSRQALRAGEFVFGLGEFLVDGFETCRGNLNGRVSKCEGLAYSFGLHIERGGGMMDVRLAVKRRFW